MRAISAEKCISEGKLKLQTLFEFVRNNAKEFKAYEMEKSVLEKVLKIGLIAMQYYFSQKGTSDIGPELRLDTGRVLKRESGFRERDYYSIFGKLKVPRSCYRIEGNYGVMPLDAKADLPDRCYSYVLQEVMDILSIRDSFDESEITLSKLLGLNVKASRFEVINQDTCTSYDEFYESKQPPPAESEGEIQVLSALAQEKTDKKMS